MLSTVYIPSLHTDDPSNIDISDARLWRIYDDRAELHGLKHCLGVSQEELDELIGELDQHRKWVLQLRELMCLPYTGTTH